MDDEDESYKTPRAQRHVFALPDHYSPLTDTASPEQQATAVALQTAAAGRNRQKNRRRAFLYRARELSALIAVSGKQTAS